jgi:hypothetical protein
MPSFLDKPKLTGQSLGRVFNSRSGCLHAMLFFRYEAKVASLELKTRPNQLLGHLLLYIAVPAN